MDHSPKDMHGTDSEIFLVGDLRVDVGQQRVTRADSEITLPNLSFQLLLALIRVAPNVLSHELLMARVWPGLIVSPETVAKRVNLLREALRDNAQEPHYIAGVRSRGYQLVAAVSAAARLGPPAEGPSSAPVAVTEPDELSTRDAVAIEPQAVTKTRRMRWLVLPVLLAGIFAIAIGMRMANRDRAVVPQLTTENPLGETDAIGTRARTVAVMPFDNISADAADAYLAQGLPEMILNRMSQIAGLSVIARSSSFALATKPVCRSTAVMQITGFIRALSSCHRHVGARGPDHAESIPGPAQGQGESKPRPHSCQLSVASLITARGRSSFGWDSLP